MAKLPELLAPAGSLETFKAGFDAGADAFYLGFSDFNARRRAKNFTEDELHLAVDYAHQAGKKIYITLNTLIFDREIPALIRVIEFLREIKADGVIVQDWGVISILREEYPGLPIHASTQMFCHNSLHAEFLRSKGISRIILPRELTLDEIGAIMKQAPLEYEVFIHGAMCFSFSGCCLASSYLYGESGNRGECRQICRFPLSTDEGTAYPFSMKDLRAGEIIGKLIVMGVSALKIEGRLKNAAYVAETVSAYRRIIDTYGGDADKEGTKRNAGIECKADIENKTATEPVEAPHNLARQRETSSGYFVRGPEYERLVQRISPGTSGEVFGKVRDVRGNEVRIDHVLKPEKGMRLRIQDARGKNIHEGALLDFYRARSGKGKEILIWKTPAALKTEGYASPFTVYHVGRSAPRNIRRLLERERKKICIETLSLNVHIMHNTIHIETVAGGFPAPWEKVYPLLTMQSVSSPLNCRTGEKIFSQVDRYPFQIKTIVCHIEENLFCPVSELKKIRRLFYRELNDFFLEREETERNARYDRIMGRRAEILKRHVRETESRRFILFADFQQPEISKKPEYTVYRLEVGEIPEVPPASDIMILPPLFVSEELVPAAVEWVGNLVSGGYTRFMIPTYGWLILLENYPAVDVTAGPFLYLVNPLAVEFLKKSGVHSFVLSPDIRAEDAGPLVRFDNRLIPLNAPKEMFVSRLRAANNCFFLKKTVLRPRQYREYTVYETCK
jgi:U32 family peptidase